MTRVETLGPVGFNPTGAYDPTKQYTKLDVVYYQGSSYVATADSIGQLPTNSDYWDCIALGTLKQFTYNSVAEMKLDNSLEDGMFVETAGYYAANDGGRALYKIVNDNSLVDDGGSVHELNNGLFAVLIANSEVNVKQFGAYGDNTHNDTTSIQNAIDYTITGGVIVFPVGKYLVNNLNITKSLTLKGLSMSGLDGETSLCLKDENNKILTINSQPNIISGFKIENLCFSGRLLTTNVLCDIKYLSNLLITNCVFKHVNGSAIKLQRVMESTIFNSVILRCGNETNSAIELLDSVNQASENCNNIHIDNCTFGQNGGNWIKCTNNSNVDVLWITNNKFEHDGPSIVANANNTAVIYLGKNARTNILNNTFTQFTDVRNKYVKIIEFYSGGGPISILNNKINGCKGTFITSTNNSGIIISDNNIMTDCDDTMTDANVVTNAYTNINPTILLNSNGSLPTRYSNYKYTFTPFYSLCASVKHNIQYDADSVNYLKNCVLTTPYTEIARIKNIYKNLNTDFKIKFRAKKLEDSTPSPHLFLYKKGSSDTMIGDVAITSTDFNWYEFTVANADILDANFFFMTSGNTAIQALLDVIIINA